MLRCSIRLLVWLLAAGALSAQSNPDTDTTVPNPASIDPTKRQGEIESSEKGVNWKGLLLQSGFFLGVQHGFRLWTEPGTREGLKGKYWPEYGLAVGNMHGWSDGDPFFVNYIGHPMQGAVSGYLWTQNDRRFYSVEFGKNRPYWESRLRAGAFGFLYSAQFEIGPLSEASIGKVQRYYPSQGFVDFVITPTIGMAWMIGEDAVDKYVIMPLERRINNGAARALIRGGLNPARTFANGMRLKAPWYRDNRPWSFHGGRLDYRPQPPPHTIPKMTTDPAPLELDVIMRTDYFVHGNGAWCLGGGGTISYRLSSSWQWMGDISGCNLMGLANNQSGDIFTFLTGPKWTPRRAGRWKPSLQILFGGTKATVEIEDPVLKAIVQSQPPAASSNVPAWPSYLTLKEDTGFALAAGGGLDFQLNRAIELRVARLEYRHAWLNTVAGRSFSNALQFSSGLTIRIGTW